MKYCSLFVVTSLLFGCAAGNNNTKQYTDNTEVVVHYNGKEVHRRGSKYISQEQLTNLSDNGEEIIVIFSADWCKACDFTRKLINRVNFKAKIYYLNLDELWVKKVALLMKVKTIPYMVHTGRQDKKEIIKIGPGPIVEYLLSQF